MGWRKLLAIAAGLGLVGCAAAGTGKRRPKVEEDNADELEPELEPAPQVGEPKQPIFDPNYQTVHAPKAPAYFYRIEGLDLEGKLLRALETACKRWAKATGVRIEVGRGSEIGLASGAETEHTVQWWPPNTPPLNNASGHVVSDNWMKTEVYITEAMQSAPAVGLSNLLTHELGHSLSRKGWHTETGITAEGFSSFEETPINDEDLTFVCERLLCNVYQPEVSVNTKETDANKG